MPTSLQTLFSGRVASVQVVTVNGAPTGGTWQPGLNGVTTGTPVAYNATAAVLQSSLEAAVGAGNVAVTGAAGGPYTVTFSGTALSATGSSPVVSMVGNTLTGGASPNVTAAGTDVTVYTVAGGKAVKVATGTLTNIAPVPATVGIGVVPSGSTAGAAFKSLFGRVLDPNDTIPLGPFIGGDMLGAGDSIAVFSSVPGGISAKLTGAVLS